MEETRSVAADISAMLIDSNQFNDLTPAELRTASGYFSINTLDKGAAIFKEGDAGTFMCIIHSGTVGVTKSTNNVEEEALKIALLHKGRTFGEMAVLDGERRSATCIAMTECTLLMLSKSSLDRMMADAPKVAAKVIRSVAISLSRRLRMTTGKLADRHA